MEKIIKAIQERHRPPIDDSKYEFEELENTIYDDEGNVVEVSDIRVGAWYRMESNWKVKKRDGLSGG